LGQKIQKLNQDSGGILDELKLWGRLDRQLRGQDQPKISLKRFFLAQRLEDVLRQASRRMQILSSGRFTLKRSQTTVRTKAAQTGLDLLVEDSYTGTERTVNSLSGGQLFLASLSMALGLADVVQARSGAIRLDTLFIDEGFGSLDDETLQLAMKVLNDLREGRMVGVISHVAELKRQIDTRIEVTEAETGSKVTLTVGE
jgi:DNA repair protein SbcC/Rad50